MKTDIIRPKKIPKMQHEGIRPTYADLEPDMIKDYITKDQYKLYKLIYNRFMASQMSAAIYDTMAVTSKQMIMTSRQMDKQLNLKDL